MSYWGQACLVFLIHLTKSETITCDGGCDGQIITCTSNPCVINCNNGVCVGATTQLNCGNNADCTVNCLGGGSSCDQAIIDGTEATTLNVNADDYSYVLSDATVYCPLTGDSNCNINCGGIYIYVSI